MIKISIKAARVNANLTQREVAEKLGISRDALMKYEKTPEIIPYSLAEQMSVIYKIPKENLVFLK